MRRGKFKKKEEYKNLEDDEDNVHEWDDIDETKEDEKLYYNMSD